MKKEIAKQNNSNQISNSDKDCLGDINLSLSQTFDALKNATVGTVISNIPILNKMYEWMERVEQDTREKKLNILFNDFKSKFDSIDEAFSKLKTLVATRGGQTIFRKLVQIVDKGSEDQEWIDLLANVLKTLSESSIEKYFDDYEYLLAQIDRLTPHGLILLSKNNIWKEVNIQGTTTTSNQTMGGNWPDQATSFFMRKIGIVNLMMGGRINHTFRELESAGILTLSGHQLKLTAIGLEIYRIINDK